ncbi:unnamed protein product [Macrosiphum euphorbiae]|uniref:Uncharacterized protein n=1 Tax=Macrosiphum euphorbiae TaxID=13131 RepID=A0AAV0XX07_9HEMI|nr:unnamed protein product [Macrosiphum euphorbiae]
MNSIIVVTICAMLITFSEADIKKGSLLNIPARVATIPSLENIRDACMLMGTANYSASSMDLASPQIGGCLLMEIKQNYRTRLFTLWLGNSQNDKQQCGQEGMEQLIFACDEYPLTTQENIEDGAKFVRLYGENVNKMGGDRIRCALFEKNEINSNIFRLAVSGNNSCSGLAKVFYEKPRMMPKGSTFLQLTRYLENQEHQSKDRLSVSNPTPAIENQLDFLVKFMPTPLGSNFLRLMKYPENQEHQSRDRRSVINPTPTSQTQDLFTKWRPPIY